VSDYVTKDESWFETATPEDLRGRPVKVACGDGCIRIVDATEVRNDYRHLTWIAWSPISVCKRFDNEAVTKDDCDMWVVAVSDHQAKLALIDRIYPMEKCSKKDRDSRYLDLLESAADKAVAGEPITQ